MKRNDLDDLRWITVKNQVYLGILKKGDKKTEILGIEVDEATKAAVREWFIQENIDELILVRLAGQYSYQVKKLDAHETRVWNECFAHMEYIKGRALAMWENNLFINKK